MAIGTPLSLGIANNAVSANTQALTTTATAPAGNCIIVFVQISAGSTITVTDSASNTYTQHGSNFVYSVAAKLGCFYCANPSALASGGTITATWTGTAGKSNISAMSVSGLSTTPADLAGAGTTGTGTTGTFTTGTLAQASELVVGAAAVSLSIGSFTEGAGFTNVNNLSTSTLSTNVGAQIVSATTAVAYAPSWTTSRGFGVNAWTFKGGTGSPYAFAGNSTGLATTSLSDVRSAPLAGSSAGVGATTGSLIRQTKLAGSSAGVGATTGAMIRRAPFSGVSAGVGTTTLAYSREAPLVGASAGLSTTSAATSAKRPFGGTSFGQASTSADLQGGSGSTEADMVIYSKRRRR